MNSSLLFLGDIGGSELILIMVVILIFFGANKIPELARGLGKGIREFKDASSEIRNEFERAGQTPPNQQYNQNQGYNPNQPNQAYNPNQGYNPNQPNAGYSPQHPNTSYDQQAAPYQPTSGDYVAPVADYTAPGAVDLPTADQPTYHQSTPIPPTTDGVPGTRPRLDQSSTGA
jgi:sec-independent protein translocase protein TatA